MHVFRRYVIAAPIAATLTLGLGFIMTELIASDDLQLVDSAKIRVGAVNPVVIDIEPPSRIERPKIKAVQVPPAPPSFERTKSGAPVPRGLSRTHLPDFVIPKPQIGASLDFVKIQDVKPIERYPPRFPMRAEKSGYCKLTFDVSADGSPFNVVATQCSQSVFERASISSVQKWKYLPQYRNGIAVPYIGLKETIRFNLLDDNGNRIPE